ncbi:Plastid lipid-associated protein/fibrillin conserved domain-containing protein [Artemisia annua]|uniref:Plastid lipid-associated protein/fibrillin conserved domain-containing protein n=1 Tax=Artemisia annua TaxID=35608 RepID=A0A2U1LQP2_ARTAN|nr:Plastid lipid-associated protein/fibrillin conserved domain-containing protein [Artemisia annua]
MASLLTHSSISPSNTRTQSCFVKQSKTFGFNVNNNNTTTTRHVKLSKRRPSIVTLCAAVQEQAPSFQLPDLTKDATLKSLKFKLLGAVSGLNRGLVASEEDLQKADSAAKEIEEFGGPVDLSADIDKLQGRWKLIYSSAFSSRTLGGSRPGPPTGRLLPITLGQVFQRIDILSKDFDNIVELELGAPWPLQPVEVTATLAHKFEIIGSSTIKIIFEKTTVKTTGNLSQLPPLEIPQLPEQFRPTTNRGSGEFEVTYLDSDLRITRGDRGELRVFVVS